MSLLARASIVSAATLGSRILGFARDAATAAVLGVGPVADGLVAALALPLLARRLLAEGAFNLAFIPALALEEGKGREGKGEHGKDTPEGPRALAKAALVLLSGTLLVSAVLGALFMRQLIGFLAPGFEAGGERADVAVMCGRVALLYLPLSGLAAIYGGIANRAHRVLLPALAPMAANIVVLAVVGVLIARGLMESDTAAFAIAAATVAAGLAQFLLMRVAARGCPATRMARVAPKWREGMAVLRAASPALLFAGMSQFRLIIIAALVSAAPGAVAALNYAQRLMDLPLGLVGASAGAVLLPALVRQKDEGTAAGRALVAALAFALPAAVGLAVLAEPIVVTLFQRGSFDAEDARFTAALLAVLALSLPLQGIERILSATAAASGLIKEAERIALASLVLCLGAAAALGAWVGPQGAAGAAAASAGASIVTLGVLLHRRGALRLDGRLLLVLAGLAAGALLMGGGVLGLARLWPAPEGSGLAAAVRLAILIGAGGLIYGLAALPLRALLKAGAKAAPPSAA